LASFFEVSTWSSHYSNYHC